MLEVIVRLIAEEKLDFSIFARKGLRLLSQDLWDVLETEAAIKVDMELASRFPDPLAQQRDNREF